MTRKDPQSSLSPVFARAEKARPRVRQPNSPWTVPLGVVGASLLGVMVFSGLSNVREAKAQAPQPQRPAANAPPAPPPPAVAPAPPPAPAAPNPAPPTLSGVGPPPDPEQAHWRAPTMVVDFSTAPAAGAVQVAQAAVAAPPANEARQSADERFSARVTGALGGASRASQMHDLGRMVPQGSVIAAVLETAIDSDLPGSVRAVVSRDVKSFDGSQVLIPRGSKLIGQYRSSAAIGQTRAFVIWQRIITPHGVTIEVGSPATDRLGRGGLDGKVDTHFFRRFGAAILLSAISAGFQAAANDGGSGGDTLIIGSPAQASNVAEIALSKHIDIPDTIRVKQGAPVQVFVARDLDFSLVAR